MYKCNLESLAHIPDDAPKTNFAPLPKGNYNGCLISDIIKTSKKDGTQYYSLKFLIIDGDYKGRYVFKSLLLNHPKEEVRMFAQKFVKQLLTATGVEEMNDFEEFYRTPLCLHIGVKDGDDKYPASNEIWGIGKEKENLRDKPFEDDLNDDIPF